MADAYAELFHEFTEQVASRKKSSDQDSDFLEEDREHGSRNPGTHGDDKYDVLRLAIEHPFRKIKTEHKSDSAQKEPVKPSPHEEHSGSQKKSE